MSKDEVVMACMRVADLPIPAVPANVEDCRECKEPVWVDETATHDAVICIQCLERSGLKVSDTPHPAVVKRLLARGMTMEEIRRENEYAARTLGPRREG